MWRLLLSCASPPDAGDGLPTCEPAPRLFGRPTAATGLGDDRCGPVCECGGERFEAPSSDDADLDALLAWTLLDPYPEPIADPYAADPPPAPVPGVCAVVVAPDGYRLETFADAAAASSAGGHVTHDGGCGVCSTLEDLATYARYADLTAPVRDCGIAHFAGPREAHVACLRDLGFTAPCASIWYANTVHTRDACRDECLAAIDAPYHTPDGALNACLQCDEDESGAVFLAIAGRTRRNTGLASSMCRPCEEVRPIVHDYGRPR